LTRTERAAPAAGRQPDIAGAVADAFAQVLEQGRDVVSAHSDFFDLGGNSIQGAQLVARLRHAVPVKVTIRDLFRARTVGALVTVLEERAAVAGGRGSARPPR
jgi:acyl carrier protein